MKNTSQTYKIKSVTYSIFKILYSELTHRLTNYLKSMDSGIHVTEKITKSLMISVIINITMVIFKILNIIESYVGGYSLSTLISIIFFLTLFDMIIGAVKHIIARKYDEKKMVYKFLYKWSIIIWLGGLFYIFNNIGLDFLAISLVYLTILIFVLSSIMASMYGIYMMSNKSKNNINCY